MNYEELLETRNASTNKKEQIPFGLFYKKMEGNKYVNAVDLRQDLADSLVFCEDLSSESEQNATLNHQSQIHFTVNADSGGAYGITIPQGTYRTFERLLDENPAVVAEKDFIEKTIKELLESAEYLHSKGIQHVCYSPSNVFARKSDNAVMLLFHGSAYKNIREQQMLYNGSEGFLAPEVTGEGTIDDRSDIYSIGKFIAFLFNSGAMPMEIKSAVAKATNDDPGKRYQSARQMLNDITRKRNAKKSILTFIAAAAIALICVGFYFSMLPEQEDIEFVKPAQVHQEEDSLSGGIDPLTELGVVGNDAEIEGKVDEKKMREYEAKAEQIFRKQFTKEADRIISKVYNNTHLNSSEKQFMSQSQSMMEELVKAQMKLAGDAGLNDIKSQRIASEIIERITNQKKKELANEKSKE